MTVIYILFIFTLLVVAHELGHMLVAKFFRMRVEEFAVGMGPRILRFGVGKDGTEYTWRLFPLGGFVKIPGMMPGEEHVEDGFQSKSRAARFWTIFAGPLASLITGFLLFLAVGMTAGIPSNKAHPQVLGIPKDGPVASVDFKNPQGVTSKLQSGDVLVKIDNTPIETTDDARKIIEASAGKPITLVFQRGDEQITGQVTPKEREEGGKKVGKIGVAWTPAREKVGLVKSVTYAAERTYVACWLILDFLKRLVSGKGSAEEVGSVITIAGAVNNQARLGADWVMDLAGDISITLAVVNLLPIPVLDGGYLLLIAIETLRRRKMSPEASMRAQMVGLVIVLMLFVTVISLDVYKLINGKMIR